MRMSMRSDWPSRPTRGSRFVGLDSMAMTSVRGLGLAAQENKGVRRARIAKARSLGRVFGAVLGKNVGAFMDKKFYPESPDAWLRWLRARWMAGGAKFHTPAPRMRRPLSLLKASPVRRMCAEGFSWQSFLRPA